MIVRGGDDGWACLILLDGGGREFWGQIKQLLMKIRHSYVAEIAPRAVHLSEGALP